MQTVRNNSHAQNIFFVHKVPRLSLKTHLELFPRNYLTFTKPRYYINLGTLGTEGVEPERHCYGYSAAVGSTFVGFVRYTFIRDFVSFVAKLET